MEQPVPFDEAERLRDLYSIPLLDQDADAHFDRLTRLAAETFDAPIALISLVDAERQWFRSRVGLAATETERCHAFCAHAVAANEALVVPDATNDRRFVDNPLVSGSPDIRFYAGVPVAGPSGRPLGTLCVIDSTPRDLEPARLNILVELAGVVEREIANIHRANRDPVTELITRSVLLDGGGRLLTNARARGRSTGVLVVGVERLEPVNRRSGYDAGDRALARLAKVLTRSVRSADLVGRLPGAKLAAVVPDVEGPDLAELTTTVGVAIDRAATEDGLVARVGSVEIQPTEQLSDAIIRAELVLGADLLIAD